MSEFKSKLAPYMEGLVAEQHAMGFSFTLQEQTLRRLDSLIIENGLDNGHLDATVISLWEERLPSEEDSARNGRLNVVNKLASYMEALGLSVSKCITYGRAVAPVIYIPSEEEILKLLTHIDSRWNKDFKHDFANRLRAEYPVIFRLYYFCGLRLNEVVMLKREDVDLNKGRLLISHSKGDKDRYVFVAEDFRKLLIRYDGHMERLVPSREWFFPGKTAAKHLWKGGLDHNFQKWWSECFPDWKGKRPTIHSLRHAFVVKRINEWAKEGLDFKVMVPVLSKYLGHSSIEETYYYYSMRNPREESVRTMMEMGSIGREVEL